MFSVNYHVLEEQYELPYRHLHHAEIVRVLADVRCTYLEKIGFPLSYFFEQNLFLVVTRVDIQYKREMVAGDYVITVEEPSVLDRRRASVKQRVLNAKNKEVVVAIIEFMSMTAGRAKALDEAFKTSFLQES